MVLTTLKQLLNLTPVQTILWPPASSRIDQLRSLEFSGVASIGQGGRVPPLTAKKMSEIRKKRGKIAKKRGKSGKNQEKAENWEEKAKIGKVLSLCPSWQIGLATPLLELVHKYWLLMRGMVENYCPEVKLNLGLLFTEALKSGKYRLSSSQLSSCDSLFESQGHRRRNDFESWGKDSGYTYT